jgi:hypothetical protein
MQSVVMQNESSPPCPSVGAKVAQDQQTQLPCPDKASGHSTLTAVGIGVALAIAIATSSSLLFGSVSNTIRYIEGERLFAAQTAAFINDSSGHSSTEIEVTIFNFTSNAVSVSGAELPCNCATTQGLPMRISSFRSAKLKIAVPTPIPADIFERPFRFYVDGNTCRCMPTVTVHASPATVPMQH